MDKQPIIVEKLFNAESGKIWRAITDKNEMKSWYFDLAEFKPEPGFTFSFTGGPSPEKQYVHLCEVTEVIPVTKLTHSWRYEGYAGNSFVTWELYDKGDQTLLKLTHSGIETFPNDNADFDISNFVAGWNHIINKSLDEHLGKAV